MPSCIRPRVRLPVDQFTVFCVVIVEKKCIMASPGSSLVFCTAHRSKIPFVLTNKVTHLRSLLFRQQDGVYSVVRRAYLAITAELVPTE